MVNIDDYIEQIQNYVACLANKDYQATQELTLSDSVPVQDIQRRIEEYGNEIIPLPTNAFDLAQVYQVTDKQIDIFLCFQAFQPLCNRLSIGIPAESKPLK